MSRMKRKIQVYLLKWICKQWVNQGGWYKNNIREYFQIMVDASSNEFTEDNKYTIKHFLCDLLNETK